MMSRWAVATAEKNYRIYAFNRVLAVRAIRAFGDAARIVGIELAGSWDPKDGLVRAPWDGTQSDGWPDGPSGPPGLRK